MAASCLAPSALDGEVSEEAGLFFCTLDACASDGGGGFEWSTALSNSIRAALRALSEAPMWGVEFLGATLFYEIRCWS